MNDACCKVGVALAEYDLPVPPGASDIDDYLVDRWTGKGGHKATGYRPLTDWFNRRLLRTAYLENDRSATETRIESEYGALTGDDELRREEVIADLEDDGIDGESLSSSLVSRSTMARHLRECLGAEKSEVPGESGDGWELQKIDYGRNVFREGIVEALGSLSNKGRLPGADRAEIEIPVQLACPECATRVRLRTALRRGYVCADHLGIGESADEPE